jgi:hypothetical protein
LGVIIVAFIFAQLGLGIFHHVRYIRDKPPTRRWYTHAHLWLGRLIIVAGLFNAGLGLRQALVSWTWVGIWWAVCGALVFSYIVASVVMVQFRRLKRGQQARQAAYSPERYKVAEAYEAYEMGSRGSSLGRPRRI